MTAYLYLLSFIGFSAAESTTMESVRVADDRRGFVLATSGAKFTPRGFNYDRDHQGRLIEDYWEGEWPKVEEDFREMKGLGANVVRVHLQLGKFMSAPDRPEQKSLDRLGRLLGLAERVGLYLDITGLGCYHKKDVPDWYDRLDETGRWEVQARFWEAVAKRCEGSPAVFCYDLMNEPVVPGGKAKPGQWLGPEFGGKHFVQFITLDQADRPRPEIAAKWIKALAAAIRKHDRRHMITVGLVDWSLDRPGLTSGFVPAKVADGLDFLCVHLYPERGKVDEALATLKGFSVGKPVVIEETFPLKCSIEEFGRFIEGSKGVASGWVGFYWGQTPAELRGSKSIGDLMTVAWLEFFEAKMADDPFVVTDDDQRIKVVGPALEATIRKKGYVSGVEAQSLLDRKTGARDVGYGLDIVDWLMEPGSDEAVRDRLPGDLAYVFNNLYHGKIPKRSIEGPQICTKAGELSPRVVRGRDFVAIRQEFTYRISAPGKLAGSLWEQTIVFPAGKRYFVSSDKVTTANASDALFLRLDMPGHIKHKAGDTFSEVYLSYLGTIPADEFARDFAPDEKFLYARGAGKVPDRFIRAYHLRDPKTGKDGPWLAGMTLDPGGVSEAWCHQRGYVCMIEEIGGRPIKVGQTFGAAFIVGYFDSIAEMHEVYDRHAGFDTLDVDPHGWKLSRITRGR